MNQETIDRALGDDRRITPSPDFARRVMRSVQTEAAERQSMSFPWFLPIGALVVTTCCQLHRFRCVWGDGV